MERVKFLFIVNEENNELKEQQWERFLHLLPASQ